MDIVKDLFALLKDVGVFGFIVWGIQKIINNSSERKFADYKSQIDLQMMSYKNQYEKQIEEYKSQLKFLNDKLLSLHSERLKIIKELNDKLVKLNSAMVRLVSIRLVHPDPEKDKEIQEQILTDTQTAYADYSNFILFNSIYFDKPFAEKLKKIRGEFFTAQWDFFEPKRLQSMGLIKSEAYRVSLQKTIEASKKITEQIPLLIQEVEDDFRQLLGVTTQSVSS
ncbi:MAG: hypothetical protein H7068_04475 [Pedobacter sp.]|nr:hypothetical protein [Chitinophagaceae bacterium]